MAGDQGTNQPANAGVQDQSNDKAGAGNSSGEKTFKFEGKEYTEEQLKGLVEKADKFDNEFMPEFTRKSQRLSELEKIEQERRELEEKKNLTPDEEARKESIRSFFRDEVSRSELRKILDEERKSITTSLEFQKRLDFLTSKYDGDDGKPKFDQNKIYEFAKRNNILAYDPEDVYEKMYKSELQEWEKNRILSKVKPSTFSQRGTSGAQIRPDRKHAKTFDEAEQMLYETAEKDELS